MLMGAEQLVMSGTQWPSGIPEAEKSGWISWLEQRGGEPEGGLGLPTGRLQSQQLDWQYN